MSVLKTGAVQVGQSPTASNNFHWRNLLDGLLRLSRGNAGTPITDVMRVKADNSVEFPGGVADGVLGAGQTWQDVTGSRAGSTTYTNSTTKPIMVAVSFQGAAGVINSFTVAGLLVSTAIEGAASNQTGSVIVPAGATYSVTGEFIKWSELR